MGKIAFELSNDLNELDGLCQRLGQFCKAAGLEDKDRFHINLALDEIFTNIISHGLKDQRKHRIRITIQHCRNEVELTIEDDGIPFNPLELPVPDPHRPLNDRAVGGLGISIIRAVMDQIRYQRRDGKNILVLKKKLDT
ncbi:MAG: ATP-binding protein [Desulfobacterales bacterium]